MKRFPLFLGTLGIVALGVILTDAYGFKLPAYSSGPTITTITTTVIPSASARTRVAFPSPVKNVTVSEVDAEGLKKLLRREGAEARPLLVNFWATWCEPCRTEFPDLVRIDKDYRKRGLEFITVSLDDTENIKTSVPQFLQEMRATMPAYLLNVPDPETAITAVDDQWSGALPATFLFDGRGQIVFKHTGIVKPAELRAALEKVTRKR